MMTIKLESQQSREIPTSWVWTTIGEICFPPQYGWTTSASNEGKLKLLRTSDITSGIIDWLTVPFCETEPDDVDKYLLSDGDIVISRAGSIGYSILVNNPENSVFASYLIRFRPYSIVLDKYLSYFLKSPKYWESISEKTLGIAIPNVNASKLKQIEIPLASVAEQHRIVAKIEELFTQLDAAETALKRAKANLERYRQSVLLAAVTGELTRVWREENHERLSPVIELVEQLEIERRRKWEYDHKLKGRDSRKVTYEKPKAPDKSKLPAIPFEWDWVSVKQVGDINEQPVLTGPFGSTLGQDDFIESGTPV
ncbi:MAG: restriction endonuclease subunit S, partial [Bacillota bacterium]